MINCCYTCRWYKKDLCVNLDNWNPYIDPDEGCDKWEEGKKDGKVAWSDNNM